MSRLFDGSGDWLDYAGALVSGYPFSFGCFFKRTTVGTDYLVTIGASGTNFNYDSAWIQSTGLALAVSSTSTATSAASSIALLATDFDWHSILNVYTSASRRDVYLDGANAGSSTNTRDPVGRNALRLGASLIGTAGFNGYMCRVPFWAAALDAAEAAVFHAGTAPNLIRAGAFLEWWELPPDGSLTGYNGGVLTATGTTVSSETPARLASLAPVIQTATYRAPIVAGKRRTGGVAQADVTAPSPAPVLATPTGLTQTSIDLSWSASFDAQSGLKRYSIYRSTTGAGGLAILTNLINTAILTYKDQGLVANTTYTYRVDAEDNAGNIRAGNVVSATTLQANTGPPGPSQTKIWSRTASHPSSGQQNYENSNVIAALAKRKINSISAYPGWEKNTARTAAGKTPGIIQAIKAASTINTEVVAYLIYQSIQTVHDTPGNANYEAYQKIKTSKWFGYTNGITEATVVNDRVSGFVKNNYTDACKVVSGQIMRDWYLEWTLAFLRDGATVGFGSGYSSYTQAVNPYWDGVFIDNFLPEENAPNADYDRNGTAENPDLASSADLIQRANAAAVTKIRTMAPTWRVLGNSAEFYQIIAGTALSNTGPAFASAAGPINQILDGGAIELNIGKKTAEEATLSYQRCMLNLKTQMEAYKTSGPRYGIVESELDTWAPPASGLVTDPAVFSDWKHMRYGLCTALVTDALIYHHGPNGYKSEHLPWLNFDEYEFDLGLPIEPAQYLPRYQAGANGEGIYRRDYQNGIVLVAARRGVGKLFDASGNLLITQTAYSSQSLGGNFYRLKASSYANQDPVTNSGSATPINAITMQARDGIVLARVAQ